MEAAYSYFCSQLPALLPGMAAPMTLAEFDGKLGFLPVRDAEYIVTCSFPPDWKAVFPPGSAAEIFRNFEGALRREIALLRLAKRGGDAANRLPEGFSEPGLKDEVARAASAPNPLAREKSLNELRWRALDEAEQGRSFTREAAACYRMKLALLQKMQSFIADAGKTNFEAAAGEIDRKSAGYSEG